jgi:uncharacterized protein (TIGR00369 family)
LDYTVFEKYEGAFEKAKPEERQSLMEEMFFGAINGKEEAPSQLMEMMKMEAVKCNASELSMTMRFPIQEWQLNASRVLHGGITATILDMAMGVLAHTLVGMRSTPTVNLNVQYLAPGKEGDCLRVEVSADKVGHSLVYLMGRAFSEKTGKEIAVATCTCIRR